MRSMQNTGGHQTIGGHRFLLLNMTKTKKERRKELGMKVVVQLINSVNKDGDVISRIIALLSYPIHTLILSLNRQ